MSTAKTTQQAKEKKVPLRMCLGCRCMKPKSELFRLVKSSDGTVVFDTTQKAPGRGAYICDNPECFEKVLKTKALSRALKTPIPPEVHDTLRSSFNALLAAKSLVAGNA